MLDIYDFYDNTILSIEFIRP